MTTPDTICRIMVVLYQVGFVLGTDYVYCVVELNACKRQGPAYAAHTEDI